VGIRESILADIETTLKTIMKSGSYNNDHGLVTRLMTDWMRLQPKDYPAAIIQSTTDEREPVDLQSTNIMAQLIVIIRGCVKTASDGSDIDTLCNKWAEDIEKALHVDDERGGNANYTDPVMFRMYQLPPETKIGVFDFTFMIQYNYLKGSP